MITINLEKQLIAEKEVTVRHLRSELAEQEDLLKQVQHLLDNDHASDIAYLKTFGLSAAVEKAKALKDNINNLNEKIELGKREFTVSEIKRLAIKYNLRFLKSKHYTGSLPNDLPRKLREASEICKEQLNVDRHDNPKYNWRTPSSSIDNPQYIYSPVSYILAPMESFKLQVVPRDPLMFLQLTNGNYYLAHKWGNDLSVMRFITAWPKRDVINNFIARVIALISWVVLCVFAFIWGFKHLHFGAVFGPLTFLTGLISGFMIAGSIVGVSKSESDWKNYFSDENWDSSKYYR